MKLSAHEQHLLDFARERFGEKLAEFLLTGLGEDTAAQRGRFSITYSSDNRVRLKRRVDVITYEPMDGTSYLPRRRDPLVLLALLHLLLNGNQKLQNSLRYDQGDVLNSLGWKDTRKSRKEINGAIERYSLLTYKWKMNKHELNRRNLKFYTANGSVISQYKLIDAEADGAKGMKRVLNRVVFNEYFIEQLRLSTLFDIEWNGVLMITYSS